MGKPRGVLYGYYGYGNLGDDLFLWYLVKSFPWWGRGYSVVVPIRGPGRVPLEVIADACGDLSFSRFTYADRKERLYSKVRMACLLLSSRFLLFGGGTFLYCKDKDDLRNLKAILKQMKLVRAAGGRILGFGIGVDPISDVVGRATAREIVRLFDAMVLRDHASLENVRSMLSDKTNEDVRIVPDMAYGLTSELRSMAVPGREKYIGVNLALPRGAIDSGRTMNDLRHMIRCLQAATTYKLKYVVAQKGWGSREDELLRKIVPGLGDDNLICYDGVEIRRFVRQFSQLDVIIGTKLHVLILAHILNKPFVALEYQEKISAFMGEIGYHQNSFQFSDISRATDLAISGKLQLPKVNADKLANRISANDLRRLLLP